MQLLNCRIRCKPLLIQSPLSCQRILSIFDTPDLIRCVFAVVPNANSPSRLPVATSLECLLVVTASCVWVSACNLQARKSKGRAHQQCPENDQTIALIAMDTASAYSASIQTFQPFNASRVTDCVWVT